MFYKQGCEKPETEIGPRRIVSTYDFAGGRLLYEGLYRAGHFPYSPGRIRTMYIPPRGTFVNVPYDARRTFFTLVPCFTYNFMF